MNFFRNWWNRKLAANADATTTFDRQRLEWVAGLFVSVCAAQLVFSVGTIAYRKGWFDRHVHYSSLLETSEGVRVGSPVEMAGLRVGEVDDVELERDGRVRARWYILHRYAERVRTDSRLELVRPFIIGEKTLLLHQGSPGSPVLAENSELAADSIVGLGDLLSGRHLAPYIATVSKAMEVLRTTVDALLKISENSEEPVAVAVVKTLRQVQGTFRNLNQITTTLSKGERMEGLVKNLEVTTTAMAGLMPEIQRTSPTLTKDVGTLVANLATLTDELKKVAPEVPKTSKRMAEAIDEAVVVLKAMQKSFLLSGAAREVKEEEAARAAPPRQPATDAAPGAAPQKGSETAP